MFGPKEGLKTTIELGLVSSCISFSDIVLYRVVNSINTIV